jgi:hypothetical protein
LLKISTSTSSSKSIMCSPSAVKTNVKPEALCSGVCVFFKTLTKSEITGF